MALLLWTFLAAAIVIFALCVREGRRKRIERIYEAVSDRVSGRVKDGVLRFRLHGWPAEIRATAEGTQLTVTASGARGFLEVFPQDALPSWWFRDDVAIGDAAFDASFVVQAEPPSFAHDVFSSDRRTVVAGAIRRLAAVAPRVRVTGDGLTVAVADAPSEELIDQLSRAASTIVEEVYGRIATQEIVWIAEERGTGVCQVCGTAMDRTVVTCTRCRTPHHEECWLYAGRCSTYACRATRYEGRGRTRETRQTPDEWLREEMERDRRQMARQGVSASP